MSKLTVPRNAGYADDAREIDMPAMRTGRVKVGLILLVLFALVVIVPVSVVLLNRPTLPIVDLPTPNGFDTFVAAGKLVSNQLAKRAAEATEDELIAYLEANADALDLVKAATQQEIVVPVDYSNDGPSDYRDFTDHVSYLRQGLRLLDAEARLAKLQGKPAEAATKFLEILRTSRRVPNQGLMLHYQISAAYEGAALQAIEDLAGDLDDDAREKLRAELEAIGPLRWNHAEILEREATLAVIRHGWWRSTMISRAGLWQPALDANQEIEARLQANYNDMLEALRQPRSVHQP
jgi:hypothetical protein